MAGDMACELWALALTLYCELVRKSLAKVWVALFDAGLLDVRRSQVA